MVLNIKTQVKGKKIFLFVLITLLFTGLPLKLPQNLYLYSQNSGLKFLKNYAPKDYGHQPQNWAVKQDKRGIIYVGNHGGLLEFDGVSWRMIRIPNYSVRSMAIDDSGTIYIGGNNEIGCLAPDAHGALQYKSLLDHIKENQRNFGNVWRTHATKEGVYFCTLKFLFRWNSRQMKVWQPLYPFHTSFTCAGRFYINQVKVGLMHMVKDSLKLIPRGETFAEKKIYMMVPYDAKRSATAANRARQTGFVEKKSSHKNKIFTHSSTGRLLIGSRSKGLCLYDGIKTTPFHTGADDYLQEKQLSFGIRLANGDFVLATRFGGVVFITAAGKLKQILNKDSGLPDNNVWYVFEDFQGNLWLALNNGITKIEYASPLSFYDNRANLPGLVLSLTRHGPNKDLYAGTTSGLYVLANSGTFRPIPGMSDMCFCILSTGDSLLAATNYGIFQVGNAYGNMVSVKELVIDSPSPVLIQSGRDTNRVWAGTAYGLVSLHRDKGRWTTERKFEKISEAISKIIEDQKGNLWAGTLTKGVIKVDFPGTGAIVDAHPVVTRYDTSAGLPPGAIHVFRAAGHAVFATQKGLFRFNEEDRTFIPDLTLGPGCAGGEKGRGVFLVAEDKNKNIWFHSESINFQALANPDGTFVLNPGFFLKLPVTQVNAIYPDPAAETVWFASNEGLIRYDSGVKHDEPRDFPTLIRGVVINGRHLIYDREKFKYKTGKKSSEQFPVIDYKDRNIRFEFAAPFFEAEEQIRYQFFLQGYDNDWSNWSGETHKDYTNLDAGLYTYRVRAINVYGNLSREAAFQFRVLPPWYKTWWALLLYAAAAFLVMFFVVRWNSGRLALEKQKLEQIVKDRTKEINLKNRQLEEQSHELKELDTAKSRFFANISHEFRTPLTLIIGPLEQLISHPGDKELQRKLHLMLRNSQRLLTLINQLLELSKLDSGKMKLQAVRQNIVPFVKGIVASFDSIAIRDDLDLTFYSEQEDMTLYFDPVMIEDIMCNLLINAVKFTPAGGKIRVSIKKGPALPAAEGGENSAGSIDISVKDTGIGIPAGQLPHVFDRFYQAGGLSEHDHKGSGIGLALTKELAALHHGEIFVHSSEGEGTEFIIRLPLGKDHLKPGEIIDLPAESLRQKCLKDIPELRPQKREEEKGEEEAAGSEPGRTGENIILVVEDSADMRSYIGEALQPLYKIVTAKEGEEGIRRARETIPDLIISDVMMPEVDGYELCKILKEDIITSHIPIILLTAKAAQEDIVSGLQTGADDYITKPFSTEILRARIKNLIELRRQMQQKMQRQFTLQPDRIRLSQVDEEFIKDLQQVLGRNLDDPGFNVEVLCKKMVMSRATLYRKIEALSGESPSEYIRSHRLKRAAELLKSGFGSITEVAFEVGFSSRTYFTRCFKEKFHQLPSTFQSSQGK